MTATDPEVVAAGLVEVDGGPVQEAEAVDAERARAERLASRSGARLNGRRRAAPPAPEWARRVVRRAGFDVPPVDAA